MSANVTLEGRLTGDPELRFTPSGKAVANFTVVTSTNRKNQQTQQWEESQTTFWRCAAWGQMGENVAESLTKGMQVLVSGKAYTREYEKDGAKRISLECDVYNIAPTLKFATAKVVKAARGSSGGTAASAPADDPWASGSGGSGWSDEPPF